MAEKQHTGSVSVAPLDSLTPDHSLYQSEDREPRQSWNKSSQTSEATVASRSSKDAELLDTTKALQQFQKIRGRIEDPDTIRKNSAKWKKWKEDNETHVDTLKRLRTWVEFTSADSLKWFSMITRGKWKFGLPESGDLESLACHYFPCIGDLRVRVIDFGDGQTHSDETTLKDIHRCERLVLVPMPSFLLTFYAPVIQEKPQWAQVRWM
jgi:hypothetical protein